MVDLPQTAWIAIGIITFASALAMLHALGAAIQNEKQMQDLRLKVARLKSQYRKRLADAQEQEIIVVDEVSDQPQPIPAAA